MTNPFEDDDAGYVVLINEEGQHSLWRSSFDVPEGWAIVHPEDSRESCLDYIESNWTDMRPRSLAEDMDSPREGDFQTGLRQ